MENLPGLIGVKTLTGRTRPITWIWETMKGHPIQVNNFVFSDEKRKRLMRNPQLQGLTLSKSGSQHYKGFPQHLRYVSVFKPAHTVYSVKDKLRQTEAYCLYLSVVILVLIIIEAKKYSDYKAENQNGPIPPECDILRSVIMFCIIASQLATYMYYRFKVEMIKCFREVENESTLRHVPKYLRLCVWEWISQIWFIPPGLDLCEYPQIREALLMLSMLRGFHVIKLIYEKSQLTDPRAITWLRRHHQTCHVQFYVKARYAQGSIFLVLLVIFLISGILGCLIREIEATENHDRLSDTFNAFWLSMETVLSIGYGELIPDDHIGRFVVTILAAMSLYLLGYLILVVNRKFILSDNERRCFFKSHYTLVTKPRLRKCAARFIQGYYRLHRARRQFRGNRFPLLQKAWLCKQNFKEKGLATILRIEISVPEGIDRLDAVAIPKKDCLPNSTRELDVAIKLAQNERTMESQLMNMQIECIRTLNIFFEIKLGCRRRLTRKRQFPVCSPITDDVCNFEKPTLTKLVAKHRRSISMLKDFIHRSFARKSFALSPLSPLRSTIDTDIQQPSI